MLPLLLQNRNIIGETRGRDSIEPRPAWLHAVSSTSSDRPGTAGRRREGLFPAGGPPGRTRATGGRAAKARLERPLVFRGRVSVTREIVRPSVSSLRRILLCH